MEKDCWEERVEFDHQNGRRMTTKSLCGECANLTGKRGGNDRCGWKGEFDRQKG